MLDELIDRLIDECETQEHHDERLSWRLVEDMCHAGADGVGLMTLAMGVMGMGLDRPDPTPLLDDTTLFPPIPDPAGRRWAGKPAGLGKHLTDHRKGGLLGPHIDGSALTDVYNRWGWPPRGTECDLTDFRDCRRWKPWIDWAEALVQRREVLSWSIEWWLRKYWCHHLVRDTKLPARIIRARIANSRPGWLRSIPGSSSFREHAVEYLERKRQEGMRISSSRGVAKYRRTLRQVGQCERVATIWRHVRGAS